MKAIKNIIYYKNMALDIYLPEKANFKTFIYYHGGGMAAGTKDEIPCDLPSHFTDLGFCFVSVDYSMYPNVKFPDYLVECAHSIKFIFDNIQNYGGNSKEIYVTGSSAGAWLTLMLCLNKQYLKDVGIDTSEIKGWISDSAQCTSHFNVQHFEKNIEPFLQRIDEYAPLYYVSQDTTSNPILLIYYEDDMPCRLEQNLLLYSTLKHFNKSINVKKVLLSGGHCSGSSQKDNGEYRYLKEIVAWIDELENN